MYIIQLFTYRVLEVENRFIIYIAKENNKNNKHQSIKNKIKINNNLMYPLKIVYESVRSL